jgi:putative endonuclease
MDKPKEPDRTEHPAGAGARIDPRGRLGRVGESFAAAHLSRLGFAQLECNARTRHGEIDLIAYDGETLLFAEVKTRRVAAREPAIRTDQNPLSGLSARQRARVRRLAAAWLSDGDRVRPSARRIRFDAIGVIVDTDGRLRRLEHVEGAF